MIRLDGVSKSFAGQEVLHPTTLHVARESTLVLIGPSGCGKSTLLRLVTGLLKPDTGTVSIAGVPMNERTRQTLRHRMGYVLQDGGLFPHLTAAGNVSLLAEYLGWSTERIHHRIAELSELVSLPEELLRRYPVQLSGGQRQRVGLMRGLMMDPEILLFDEPLGGLDPIVRSALQTDLRRIFRTLRKTVLFVTHDMSEAVYFGDEIALMRHGSILQRGTPEALLYEPATPYVSEFIRAQRPVEASL